MRLLCLLPFSEVVNLAFYLKYLCKENCWWIYFQLSELIYFYWIKSTKMEGKNYNVTLQTHKKFTVSLKHIWECMWIFEYVCVRRCECVYGRVSVYLFKGCLFLWYPVLYSDSGPINGLLQTVSCILNQCVTLSRQSGRSDCFLEGCSRLDIRFSFWL